MILKHSMQYKHIVCECAYVCVCHVILDHDDKNVRAELIWRFLIATMKMSIHISQSKAYFHVQRSLKPTLKVLNHATRIPALLVNQL